MVDGKPCFSVLFMRFKRDEPCWFAFGFARGVLPEAKVRRAVLIRHELTVVPGGERFIAKDFVKFREVFDQMFKLLGIVSIPRGGGEPVDHPCADIDADVELDAVLAFPMPFDPDVIPGAAVMSAKSAAVNCNRHLFPSEELGDPVHHPADVSDGKPVHPAVDHAMSWENRAAFSEGLAIFYVRFYPIVGLIESYLEETPYGYSLWVVSFPSLFVGFPWRWQAANRFDHRLGELGGEVAVYMVHNCWINTLFCTSHPAKKMSYPL